MPLWTVKHSPDLFSLSDRQTISKAATKIYKSIHLPDFYVQVIFHEVAPTSLFVGGDSHPKYANIEIHHIAHSIRDEAEKKTFLNAADAIFSPLLGGKGAAWEYFVSESPRDMWKINGMFPPAEGSDMEKKWEALNRPVAE